MSSGNRRNRGALIALGMALVAIVLASWFSQPANNQERSVYTANAAQNENSDISRLVAAISSFDPWEDTYAQWIMATLSVVATGFSVWAVFLVKRTLSATRDTASAALKANEQAREFFASENRPWVTIKLELDFVRVFRQAPGAFNSDVSKQFYSFHTFGSYAIKDIGSTPATNVASHIAIFINKSVSEVLEDMQMGCASLQKTTDPRLSRGIIPPGEIARIDISNHGKLFQEPDSPFFGSYVGNSLDVMIGVYAIYQSNFSSDVWHNTYQVYRIGTTSITSGRIVGDPTYLDLRTLTKDDFSDFVISIMPIAAMT